MRYGRRRSFSRSRRRSTYRVRRRGGIRRIGYRM